MQSRDRVVVIGAGLGGLAAALRLAHAGLAVTVVERHAAPGGKMRTVESATGPVDAGPTVMTMRAVFDALFEDVGARLEGHVTLVPERVLARHWWPDGTTLDLFADRDESAAAIRAFGGPRAEADFRGFCRDAAALFTAFDAPMMRAAQPDFGQLALAALRNPAVLPHLLPGATLKRALALRFRDRRLRQLFGRYATYVGGAPQASPAVLALIWDAEARGVWRVEGGMHRLARAIEGLAKARGATFRYGADATRIEVQNGRTAAVHLACGTRLAADAVVFNGDPAALHRGLLGTAARAAVPAAAIAPRSLSAHVWAFAATPEMSLGAGNGLVHHNVFFGPDPADEFGPLVAGRLPIAPTLYICAQDRGSGTPPPRGTPERFEIIMNAPPVPPGAPPEEEEQCRTLVFETLARFGLRFAPEPTETALTTPRGFDSLFPGSDGSLYGRSPHGLTASLKRPTARSLLPGLYLSGGGAHPGAGIPMATLSGKHAAEAILKDRASTSMSLRTGMPGGMSMLSRIAARARSRSSAS
jgi:1-hydroxycarotenoid 3,4-desaturase